MIKTITAKQLHKYNACLPQIALFEQTFPSGEVRLTKKNIQKYAHKFDFNFMMRFLNEEESQMWTMKDQTLWGHYIEVVRTIRGKYRNRIDAVMQTNKEYDSLNKKRTYEIYRAHKKYRKASALALFTIYNNQQEIKL